MVELQRCVKNSMAAEVDEAMDASLKALASYGK